MTAPTKAERERYASVSAADWEQQILDTMRYLGWRTAHFRTARQGERWVTPVGGDGKGFPDIFALHPRSGDKIAIELKTGRGTVTPDQRIWLAAFTACEIDAYVWWPHEIDEALERLQTHPDR